MYHLIRCYAIMYFLLHLLWCVFNNNNCIGLVFNECCQGTVLKPHPMVAISCEETHKYHH